MNLSIPAAARSLIYRQEPLSHHSLKDKYHYSELRDLSLVSRLGFRGQNAQQHLMNCGLPIPEQPNQALVGKHQEWILRLSQKEFWVLADCGEQSPGLAHIQEQSLPDEYCYSLYCQNSHAWLMLSGKWQSEIMSKICAVDLTPAAFPNGSIAQTSVALVNAIVVSHRHEHQPVLSILSDSSSAEYLWIALQDAMQEFRQ